MGEGAATLYSKEYFEICKKHLNPAGVITQWVPLYESDPETVKAKSLRSSSLPGRNDLGEQQQWRRIRCRPAGSSRTDQNRYRRDAEASGSPRLFKSCRIVEYGRLHARGGSSGNLSRRASDLRNLAGRSANKRGRKSALQYLAGMGVNNFAADYIAQEMGTHKEFPQDISSAPSNRSTSEKLVTAVMTREWVPKSARMLTRVPPCLLPSAGSAQSTGSKPRESRRWLKRRVPKSNSIG